VAELVSKQLTWFNFNVRRAFGEHLRDASARQAGVGVIRWNRKELPRFCPLARRVAHSTHRLTSVHDAAITMNRSCNTQEWHRREPPFRSGHVPAAVRRTRSVSMSRNPGHVEAFAFGERCHLRQIRDVDGVVRILVQTLDSRIDPVRRFRRNAGQPTKGRGRWTD
jgi:hypothetical protein